MSVETKPALINSIRNKLESLFQQNNNSVLILHNDDFIYYLNVINGLKNVLNYSQLEAYNTTMKVHYNKQAVVFNGSKGELEQYKKELYDNYGLTTTIE